MTINARCIVLSLVFGPLTEGAVVDVAAALADPEGAVHLGVLRVGLPSLYTVDARSRDATGQVGALRRSFNRSIGT